MMSQSIKNIAFFLSFYPLIFQQVAYCFAVDREHIISTNSLQSKTPSASSKSQDPNEEQYYKVRLTDSRRPVWNVAHMVNSIKELDYRLK